MSSRRRPQPAGIAVHGIRDDDVVAGEVAVLANAYSSKVGDIFEPMRIETPAPIPTWAWLLVLVVFSWGMWYLGIEYREHPAQASLMAPEAIEAREGVVARTAIVDDWQILGEQVYGNNCSACHQGSGEGLQGLFPPLRGNAVVTATDPTEHIRTILNGLQDKVIDGTVYPAPMPPFGTNLSDEEIAAVVNHERNTWGRSTSLIVPGDVIALRE